MGRRGLAVVVALCCGASAPLAAAQPAATPRAQIACVHARIEGQSKCLARGEYCARRTSASIGTTGSRAPNAIAAAAITFSTGDSSATAELATPLAAYRRSRRGDAGSGSVG
jgi:hypothetical protein